MISSSRDTSVAATTLPLRAEVWMAIIPSVPRPWRVYSAMEVRLPKPFSVAVSDALLLVLRDQEGDHLPALGEVHAANSARAAAIGRTSVLVEADRLALVGEEHHVVMAVGERHPDQVVALVEVHRDDPGGARAGELGERGSSSPPPAA